MQPDSFQQQLLSQYDQLIHFALSLTMDYDSAEDLVQETFLKALKNNQSFKDGSNLKAWLFTILKNTFINNYRSKARRKTYFSSPEIDNQSDNFEEDSNSDDRFFMDDLEKAIENLDIKQRLPIKLFITGYQYKEIAEKLDLNIGTVKSRIFFARKQLKNEFHEEYC